MVGLHSTIPADAFTADTLGAERAGNGVLIDRGLVLTIGYLITEAETVWLHLGDGRVMEGHALGFDAETGFGLVQALGRLDLDPLPFGASGAAEAGDSVVVGGVGGRTRWLAGRIAAKQEFAGYWEYLLDEAIFTYPAHPNWGGTGLISNRGELIGIGSLQLEREQAGKTEHLNMIVPIDLLKPVLDDLRKFGRVNKPARPWLGMYCAEIESKIVVVGVAAKGPAARAELRTGDVILALNGEKLSTARRSTGNSGRSDLPAWMCPHALPRGRHLRRVGEIIRPRQIPEGAAAALSARLTRSARFRDAAS